LRPEPNCLIGARRSVVAGKMDLQPQFAPVGFDRYRQGYKIAANRRPAQEIVATHAARLTLAVRRASRCRRVVRADVSGGSDSRKNKGEAKGKKQSGKDKSRGHRRDSPYLISTRSHFTPLPARLNRQIPLPGRFRARGGCVWMICYLRSVRKNTRPATPRGPAVASPRCRPTEHTLRRPSCLSLYDDLGAI